MGSALIDYIVEDFRDVDILIADVDAAKAREKAMGLVSSGVSAKLIEPDKIYDQAFDVFSPNAMGQTVSPSTLRRIAKANPGKDIIIAGSANNQIDDRGKGRREETENCSRNAVSSMHPTSLPT